MTRVQIRDKIRVNLADTGITYYSDDEINASIQDCYNEVAAKTQFLTKSTPLSWISGKTYYDFVNDSSVTDYLGCIAIFNNNTNMWLRDDISLRDFDRLRRDWELWHGAPQFWAPHSFQRVAICPRMTTATGTFVLWYWAAAPIMTVDSDVPLVATDMQDLFENYCTADLLETAEEIVKAATFWQTYDEHLASYKERSHNLAKAQLLLRI
jgi:hypothetical protein